MQQISDPLPSLTTDLPVWLFTGSVRIASEELRNAKSILSADELDRAARFHFQEDRVRWIWWRVCLRRTLAEALRLDPAEVRFSCGPFGKPCLTEFPQVHFNFSHSGNAAALAISLQGEVGLDLEMPDRPDDVLEIADHYFCPSECAALAAAPPHDQREVFFRLWTAKEAIMKVTGLGLNLEPSHVEIALDAKNRPTKCLRVEGFPEAPTRWRLHSRDLPSGGWLCAAASVEYSSLHISEG